MNKYGIEHFHIELIEETDIPEEREIYWIEKYRSFKNGYNATLDGDGKKYIDYDLVISTYKELLSITETAKKIGISEDSVSNIVHNQKDITILSASEVNILKNGYIINQYNKNTKEFIQSFPSIKAAARAVTNKEKIGGEASHIMDVCKGKRKSAYGYYWQFADK